LGNNNFAIARLEAVSASWFLNRKKEPNSGTIFFEPKSKPLASRCQQARRNDGSYQIVISWRLNTPYRGMK